MPLPNTYLDNLFQMLITDFPLSLVPPRFLESLLNEVGVKYDGDFQ